MRIQEKDYGESAELAGHLPHLVILGDERAEERDAAGRVVADEREEFAVVVVEQAHAAHSELGVFGEERCDEVERADEALELGTARADLVLPGLRVGLARDLGEE